MSLNVGKEVAALQRMTVKQLRERYAELFLMMAAGKQSSSHFLCHHRRHICKQVKGLAKFGRQLAVRPKRVR